ncbi:MAG: TIGR04255 family protein [Leisingera sp.]
MKFLQSATSYVDALLEDGRFSDKKSVQAASLELNGDEATAPPPEQIGFSYFAKSNPNEEVVRFQKDAAYLTATKYGTWKAFSKHADELLGPFINSALDLTGIAHAKLEYTDRFVFSGDPKDANLSEVLNLERLGLPSQAFENGMAWHDRRGWFETIDQGPVLINSNIALADVTPRDQPNVLLKSIHIVTVVETRFEQLIEEQNTLSGVVDSLHKVNKETLRSAITENAANSVGL